MVSIPAAMKHLKVVQGRITRSSNGVTRLYAVLKDGTVVMASGSNKKAELGR